MTLKDFIEKTRFDSEISAIYFNRALWGGYYRIFSYKHKNILVEFFGSDTIDKVAVYTNEDGSIEMYINTINRRL